MSKKEEIKNILLQLENVEQSDYNKLIITYGKDVVDDIISQMAIDGDCLLNKFEFLFLNDNFKNKSITAFQYYSKDIEDVLKLSLEEKKELIDEIVLIIKELNELFDRFGNVVNINNKRSKPWISDKVEYCLVNCSDKVLLNRIKDLYNIFVEKRNKLVEDNLKFVILVSKNYYSKDNFVEFEDLIQYGNLGLIKAVEMYNPDYDTEFITYAFYWIKQSIVTNSKKVLNHFKVPGYIYNENILRMKVIDELMIKLGREPSNIEVANHMGLSISQIKILNDTFLPLVSLDEYDYSSVESIVDDTVDLEKDMFNKSLFLEIMKGIVDNLNDREIFILRNMYGFDDCLTEVQVSKILGISSQRVNQLKIRAFQKLRKSNFRMLKEYLR